MGNCCCPSAGPVPSNMQDLVGNWTYDGGHTDFMRFRLEQNGQLEYERVNGGARTRVNAHISSYESDMLSVRVCGCCGVGLHIDEGPRPNDKGVLVAKVNGMPVVKTPADAFGAPTAPTMDKGFY